MAAKKKVYFPKTRLTELVARAGGMTRDDAVDGAMKTLESMRAESDGEIRHAIAAMEDIAFARNASGLLDNAQMLAIQRHADQVVTLAGTFGYASLDAAARSLCDIADGFLRTGLRDVKPIAVHIQAMHLMAPGALALSPEHSETMLGELAKVTGHFNFGSLGATQIDDGAEIIAATAK
ncbi:MAG TPA: hypothetical protein VGC36_11410 [Rhizomicrobium sp.]